MKLPTVFLQLAAVQKKLNAPDIGWKIGQAYVSERQSVRFDPIEKDNVGLEELQAGPGGLFQLEGQQVVIYIKDHTRRPEVHSDPNKGNKIHLKECRTIREMKQKKRYDRYVATSRRDNKYRLDIIDENSNSTTEIISPIHVCINCLRELDYNHSKSQGPIQVKQIQAQFDIVEFLEIYSNFFGVRPKYTANSAPPSRYVDNWSSISSTIRRKADWCCQKCSVKLSGENKRWLHVHHKNGVKGDNSEPNLVALCVLCHSYEPNHEHMHVDRVAKKLILQLRKEQSL